MTVSRAMTVCDAPAPDSYGVWFLLGFLAEGQPAREIPLNRERFQVGRLPHLPLTLTSRSVSKLHAEFIATADRLFVRDLNSMNGTYVNGRRITEDTPVGEGDLVQFANVEFRVSRRRPERYDHTLQWSGQDDSWSLTQFTRLMRERAVVPFYQPIVNSSDGTVIGYEALARSRIPGMENPRDMFRMAAGLHLEVEFSRLCRWNGVSAGRELPGHPILFVNTHPAERLMDDVVPTLRELRQTYSEVRMALELHESAVTDLYEVERFRGVLRELAIQLAYDDFGAGQARLLDLVRVPPDYLKFDIGLVRNIHTAPPQQQQMVATLVRMVCDFGIAPLAEGIECREEADVCRQLGFQLAQGYYFGRPASVEQLRGDG